MDLLVGHQDHRVAVVAEELGRSVEVLLHSRVVLVVTDI
jgi:hypothetical protein